MVIHELSHQTSDIHEMTLSTVIIDLHKVDNLNSLYFLYIHIFKNSFVIHAFSLNFIIISPLVAHDNFLKDFL